MFDLWEEASRDVEAEERTRRLTSKKIAVAPVWSFLANADSTEEFNLRLEMGLDRIAAIAGDELPEVCASLRSDFELLQESRNFHESAVPQVGNGVEDEAEAESEVEPQGGLDTLHVAVLKFVTAEGAKYIIVDEESGYKVGGPYNDHGDAVAALTSPKFKGREVKVEKSEGNKERGNKEKQAPGKETPKTKEHKPRLKGGAPKAKNALRGPGEEGVGFGGGGGIGDTFKRLNPFQHDPDTDDAPNGEEEQPDDKLSFNASRPLVTGGVYGNFPPTKKDDNQEGGKPPF